MGSCKEYDAIDLLRSQGHLTLPNLVPDALIDQVGDELEPWFEITPRCQGDFYGWETTRFGSLFTKSPTSRALATHPVILPILESLLGPNCDWYQLNLSQAVRIHPKAPAQPPHRDEDMWPGPKSFEYLINVMWAVDDFTEKNGGTRIWPRSQFLPRDTLPKADTFVPTRMPKGSASLFLGSMLHGGGANTSETHRTGIIFSYCLGWLKQYENQFLTYPPSVARDFPEDIQKLIGYRIHRPNLGGYENQCPTVLFDDERPSALPAIDALPADMEARAREHKKTAA